MKAIVVGGGVIGLAASIILARAGVRTKCFDAMGFHDKKDSSYNLDSRVWALGPKSLNLLSQIGLKKISGTSIKKINVFDFASSASVNFSDYSSFLAKIVYAREIRNNLIQVARETYGLELVADSILKISRDKGQWNVYSSESIFSSDFVVLAGGKTNFLNQMVGLDSINEPDEYEVLSVCVKFEKPHENESTQIFTPDGPIAILPIESPDKSQTSGVLVWTIPKKRLVAIKNQDGQAFQECVSGIFENRFGKITLISEPVWSFASQSWLVDDSKEGLLAIGDSSHRILPFAGLGVNLGFADVQSIQDVLEKVEVSGRNCAKVGRLVTLERRIFVQTIIVAMSWFDKIFRSENNFAVMARGHAFRFVDRSKILKNLFIGIAS